MLVVVIDSNVFISSLLKDGPSRAIIRAFLDNRFEVVSSKNLLEEFIFAARRPKFSSFIAEDNLITLVSVLRERARFVEPKTSLNICRDCDDNLLLEVSIESEADILISGDKDLTSLESFRGLKILRP